MPPVDSQPEAATTPRAGFDWLGAVVLGAVGLALGISSAYSGIYQPDTWRIVALVVLAGFVALILLSSSLPRGAALVALAAMAGLALWSLIAGTWGDSSEQALEDAHRWLLYALLLAVLLLTLARERRLAPVLIGAFTAGILAIGAYEYLKLLTDGSAQFVLGRLNEPLGYTNGQGAYFLLGIWPLVAVAERARWSLLAGAALALATALAALVVLSQSRGALVAALVSAVALLAVAPGRQRRAWALLLIVAGLALAGSGLSDVLSGDQLRTPDADARSAARASLVAALVVGAAWALGSALSRRFSGRSAVDRVRLSIASGAALAVVSAVVLVALFAALDNPIGKIKDEADAFTDLKSTTAGESRLASGGGNRYDYWRIAWNGFAAEPLEGEGPGGYAPRYFAERKTTENVRQPHSLELQTLAETGLVGFAALAVALGAILLALWRRLREASDPLASGVAVAAGGTLAAWLTQTSVDWLHLIPGLTGIALCCAAVALAPSMAPVEGGWRRRWPWVAAGLVVAVIVAASLGKAVIAAELRNDAQDQLAGNQLGAINKANDSLALGDAELDTYYAKAAAYARADRYEDARATLLAAARKEPREFVTWGLLGDLAVRRGELGAAQTYYARAARLNPRDRALARLARDRPLLRRLTRDPDLLRELTPTTTAPRD